MDFIVGTFTHPILYTVRFTPPSSPKQGSVGWYLDILGKTPANSNHSFLCLSPDRKNLYATCWSSPPQIAAYKLVASEKVSSITGEKVEVMVPELINTKEVKGLSGYVTATQTHVYSAGGASGEVFARSALDGGLGNLVQEMTFLDEEDIKGNGEAETDQHGNFGGLRHGAHSIDLSPDGRSLYVADIGRNCVWTFSVSDSEGKIKVKGGNGRLEDSKGRHLVFGSKCIAPRENDGPRHCIPHPNGKVLYVVQEHTSMVDVFAVNGDGVSLKFEQGFKIIPKDKDAKEYWADEVRFSTSQDPKTQPPKYLYASTRGLNSETKGYVAVFRLSQNGMVEGEEAIDIFETPFSGGIANAIEPSPPSSDEGNNGVEYLALTDSEQCMIYILGFDGKKIWKIDGKRLDFDKRGNQSCGAATAVWL